MYFVKIPKIAQYIFPDMIWGIPIKEKVIFLTFDDGPESASTPIILSILKKHHAKATFFCTGEKAEKQPQLIGQIIKDGHSVGNHSYSHNKKNILNTNEFINDIDKCGEVFQSNLFRPPYGKINRKQRNAVKNTYKIIMWSVIPGDFDAKVTETILLKRSIRNTKKGSIIVFHDNSKTINKLEYALPLFLEHFIKNGFSFKPITDSLFS